MLEMSQQTAPVERMARSARVAHGETAVLPMATVARVMASVLLVVSPSSVTVMPRPTFLQMGIAARMVRPAREALMEIAALNKDTVARQTIVKQAVNLSSAPVMLIRARSLLMVDVEASMARLARVAPSVTAVPLGTGVARLLTVMLAASPSLALATAKRATSPPMATVVRMARLVREALTVTAVLLRATAVRRTTVKQAANRNSVLATPALTTFLPTEAVVRTERLARAVSMATAVLSTDTVEREMTFVARDVSLPTVSALVFLPTLSVVPGTVELVLALALETVVLPMVTVEAQDLTVDRAARRVPPVLV